MGPAPLGSEGGFALIGALLVTVLLTALGGAALFLAQMDLMLAGNYRVQRTAEAAADGALDLVKAMIFSNAPLLNLPLSIPADGSAASLDPNRRLSRSDIDVTYTIRYKQEDNINFNDAEDYADEVVRYGKDYNYQGAQKVIGKQPVYTVTFTRQQDRRQGRGRPDLDDRFQHAGGPVLRGHGPHAEVCLGHGRVDRGDRRQRHAGRRDGFDECRRHHHRDGEGEHDLHRHHDPRRRCRRGSRTHHGHQQCHVQHDRLPRRGAAHPRQQYRHVHGQDRHAVHGLHRGPGGSRRDIRERHEQEPQPVLQRRQSHRQQRVRGQSVLPAPAGLSPLGGGGVEGRRVVQPGAGERAHPARRRRPESPTSTPRTPPPAAAAPARRRRTRCSVSTTGPRTAWSAGTTFPSPSTIR